MQVHCRESIRISHLKSGPSPYVSGLSPTALGLLRIPSHGGAKAPRDSSCERANELQGDFAAVVISL